MTQKILKTGNSLAVTIPAKFARIMGLKPGVDVKVKSDLTRGVLTLYFSGSGQLSLLSKP